MYLTYTDQELRRLLRVEPNNEEACKEVIRRFLGIGLTDERVR